MSRRKDLLALAEDTLRLARKRGATAADALVIESTEMSAGIRNGQPETIERAESCGLGLRVFVGQSSATLSTSALEQEAVIALVERAIAIAKVAPADPFSGLADKTLLAKKTPKLDLADKGEPSMESLQEMARQAEEAGRSIAGITNSEGADAGFSRHVLALATSHGFGGHYEGTRSALSLSLIAGSGDQMQRDYDYAMAVHRADLLNPAAIGQGAAQRTLGRLHPRKLSSQQAAVFFEPRVGRSLLSALAGAISGAAIARGTSFLKNDLHKRLFSEDITIIDDPLLPRGLGSHPWDGEGVVAQRRAFIDKGLLTSWLLDTRSANQLKMATTGNAARSLSSAPHASPSNFYLAAATASPQELFRSVGSGLYVTETIGHGANLITGDYSVGASGFWLEKGEIAYPVSEITIAGNLKDIFATLVAASDLEFRYSTNVPTLMVPRMTIAGN
jgi:PmbA protein